MRVKVLLVGMAKVTNSGTRLIPDGFCSLDPLEMLSVLGNMLFRSMSVKMDIVRD